MISHIKDFELLWMQEFDKTQKVFKHIPDRALAQAVDSAGRTLGRLAWHIATTIPEMMGQTGLKVAGPHLEQPVPQSMLEIRRAYEEAGLSVLEAVKSQWTDATLEAKRCHVWPDVEAWIYPDSFDLSPDSSSWADDSTDASSWSACPRTLWSCP